jgi:23S rRNA (uracil1939-C5)-methyltransferase
LKKNLDKSTPTVIQAEVTALAFTGKGIARHNGKVCFISGALPGDLVEAVVTQDKKNYSEAQTRAILRPSAQRTAGQCRFLASCGGCDWQQLSYAEQLSWKKSFITDSLRRIGKISALPDFEVHGSPQLYHYRNRIQLKCKTGGSPELTVGYYENATNRLVPVTSCEIADPSINRFLQQLLACDFTPVAAMNFSLEIKKVLSQTEDGGEVIVTIFKNEKKDTRLKKIISALAGVAFCGYESEIDESAVFADEIYRGITLFTGPLMFNQVNSLQNANMKDHLVALMDAVNPSSILDLCCGNGNLSVHLAGQGRKVTGIELNPKTVRCAQLSVQKHQLTDTHYLSMSADAFLKKTRGEKFDLVIVDPPRAGLHGEITFLAHQRPKHIAYVSCNPTTLARDLSVLADEGYQIDHLTGFDFFPHTYHVETVVTLVRS